MADSADIKENQENQPELEKNVNRFLKTFMHVYRNSDDELDNSIQSHPVFVGNPYTDIKFVRPSDIDLSYPSPSECTNSSEMYDIDINYEQTYGIDSSYHPLSMNVDPSVISMHDIDSSFNSPPMHVEHDINIDNVTHCEIEMNYNETPVNDLETLRDLIKNKPVPLTIEIRAEIHEEPRSRENFHPEVENPKQRTFVCIDNNNENYDEIEILSTDMLYSSETEPPLHETMKIDRILPRILPEPSDLDYLRASDFKHCEDSCSEPFIWVKNAGGLGSEESNLSDPPSCSNITPLICEPLPLITTVQTNNDDISKSSQFKLPKSYFSWFKDLSDFDRTGAAGYFVDSFSALQGYLSDKPPFNVEIFHNAHHYECCDRPPPSVNSCKKQKRSLELKSYLENLPQDDFQLKIKRWFDLEDVVFPVPEIVNIPASLESEYYQSSYKGPTSQTDNMSNLKQETFYWFVSWAFVQLIASFFFGNLNMFLSTFLISCVFMGKSLIPIFFHTCFCLGSGLDVIFSCIESFLESLSARTRIHFAGFQPKTWVRKVRTKYLLKIFRFLERFSGIFLSNQRFRSSALFHEKLRKLKSFVYHHEGFRNSSVRQFKAMKLRRGKRTILQLNHLKGSDYIERGDLTVPLQIRNCVPLVQSSLGKRNFPIIIDSGCPTNILPYHILTSFENDTGFNCTRFQNELELQAHNSGALKLKTFGAIIPFRFLDINNVPKIMEIPFLLEDCTGSDIILGINNIRCLNVHVKSVFSTCTLSLSNTFKTLVPMSPVPVTCDTSGNISIPRGIPVKDGIYHIQSFSDQDYHDKSCYSAHDPRVSCGSNTYYSVDPSLNPNFLRSTPNIKFDNTYVVKSNTCVGLKLNPGAVIPGLIGSAEIVSALPSSAIRSILRPNIDKNTAYNQDITHTHDSDSNSGNSMSGSSPECETFIEPSFIDNEDHETILSPISVDTRESAFNPSLIVHTMDSTPPPENKYFYLWFLGDGPEFECLFSDGKSCSCQHLKYKNVSKIYRNCLKDKRSKFFVTKREDKNMDIFFSISPNIRVNHTPKISILIKLLQKFKVTNIILDLRSHLSHPSLPTLISDLQDGFGKVETNYPAVYNLFLPEVNPALKSPPPPSLETMRNVQIMKDQGMRGSDSIIPESVIQEQEAFPFLSVNSMEDDLQTFLRLSGGEEKSFLQDLLQEFNDVASKHPGDIGRVNDPRFLMDIILKDDNHPLPLELPYQTASNKKLACSRIVEGWLQSGIVERSFTRTHASRLTVASKHLNKTDFKKIVDRLQAEHGLDFSNLDQSEFSRIPPNLLTAYELSKGYRVCLDARALNNLTQDEIICSPNPDLMISELMFLPSDQLKLSANSDLMSNVPESLKKYFDTDIEDDDCMYYSSLDIRSAHTSLVLTERASRYLNVILPDYSLIRFLQSPFGLKTINSRWNSFITTVLHDLIQRKLVVIYADDLLILAKGRKLHRLVLIEVFRILKKYNVKLSINKCNCFVDKFQFLGFNFDSNGITLTDERISGILNLEQPCNLKGLQRILGSMVYIGRFISDLSTHLLPLTHLLNKNVPFIWGKEQSDALTNLKQLIKSKMTLKFIDADQELSLYCDSSKKAGGSVLFQEDKITKQPNPVCFFSRKYNTQQTQHYSSLELELINIIDSLSRLKAFINLSSKPIKLFTDAKAIIFLLKAVKEGPNPKLTRLASKLAEYQLNFQIEYCKPDGNQKFLIADFLSRSREKEDFENFPPPPPMQSFRKITKEHINHSLPEGANFTLTDLTEQVDKHPEWFVQFPTPSSPFLPALPASNGNLAFQGDNAQENSIFLPVLDPDSDSPKILHRLLFLRRDLSAAEIIKKQSEDKFICSIVDELTENPDLEVNQKGFFLKNLILHKLKDLTKEISTENSVLVLPEKMLPEVIGEFHVSFGHLGRDKLTSMLTALYFSPKLHKTCLSIVQGCHLCQLIKPGNARLPPLVPSKTASFPMNIMAMDFFTVPPFKGYSTVLIGIDHFSGFIFTRACKSESSSEVVNFLSKIFANFGSPICIKSDNGTSLLRSKPVRNLLALWGVEVATLSLPYTPVHNGKAERSIRAFRALVRSMSPEKVTGWYPNLNRLTFIHNSTPRTFIGKDGTVLASPFELFLRRKPLPIFPNPSLISDPSAAEYFQKSKQEIEKLDQFVEKFLSEQNALYISKMNKNARPSILKPGDLCLLRDNVPPRAGALPKKYYAPYKDVVYILRFVKDMLAVLEDPLTGNILYQNVRFVKRYKSRDEVFRELSPELQKVLGTPFNPLNFKSRRELIDFLATNQLTGDHEDSPDNQSILSDNSQDSVHPAISTAYDLPVNNMPQPPFPPSSSASSASSVLRPQHGLHNFPPAPDYISDEFHPEINENVPTSNNPTVPANPSLNITSDPIGNQSVDPTPNPIVSSVSSNPWKRLTRAAAKLARR